LPECSLAAGPKNWKAAGRQEHKGHTEKDRQGTRWYKTQYGTKDIERPSLTACCLGKLSNHLRGKFDAVHSNLELEIIRVNME